MTLLEFKSKREKYYTDYAVNHPWSEMPSDTNTVFAYNMYLKGFIPSWAK